MIKFDDPQDVSTRRAALGEWLDSNPVRFSILGVIAINGAVLGLETSKTAMALFGDILATIDTVCLVIFVTEIVLKLIAFGWRFFRDPWNVFDFLVVGISLAPASEGLSVLRALRILRVLRVISFAPRLRRVVEGLINAMPGMASVFLLMSIIFYIGAVIATKIFGDVFPQWFGTLGHSAYSLFQIMTLESWSMGIVRPVMEVYPYAWMFFVPFILVTTFAALNLLVGLVVNSMQDAHTEEETEATGAYRDEVLGKLAEITERLDRLEKRK